MIKNMKFILADNPMSYIRERYDDFHLLYSDHHINIHEYTKKIAAYLSNVENSELYKQIYTIWLNVFNEKLGCEENGICATSLVSGEIKSLKFFELILLELTYCILSKESKYDEIYVPLQSIYLFKNNPMLLLNIIDEIGKLFSVDKTINIITNDEDWANIFTDIIFKEDQPTSIKKSDFYWVESDLDIFTYQIFFPQKKFKRAGSSSNIFKIIEKNPSHKAIIDKDGFTNKNMFYLKQIFDLSFTNMIECENIWLHSDLIAVLNTFSPKKIDISKFSSDVIVRAFKNLDQILLRLRNRQDYLMYNYIPYLSEEEINERKEAFLVDLRNHDYNSVLKWFDNKKLFSLYLKQSGYKDLAQWKSDVEKNKHLFLNFNKEKIIL